MKDRTPLKKLAKGFTKRTLVTASFAGSVGLRYVKRSMGSSSSSEGAAEKAVAIVEQLGAMKGLAMKAGQIASYMPGALPDGAQQVFERLQAQSTPMAFEVVEEVFEREFGRKPDEAFESFERTPMAAASIGQVHRARIDGRQVAVKIQYPEIEELVRSDLKMMGMITKLLVVGTPNDGDGLARELRERMLEECDYELEARRQRKFRELYVGLDGCRVPEVIEAFSSRRVLTTELIEGLDFNTFCDRASQDIKNRAAESIFKACFYTLFRHAMYNGDPHPGNYIFDEAGGVTFLDFGCVREFSKSFMDNWKPMELAMLDGDRARLREVFPATGMMGVSEDKFDWDEHYKVMEYVCRPYIAEQPFTFTQDYVQESYDKVLFNTKAMKILNTPPEWLLINRVHWGLNSVLGRLEATADFGAMWRTAVSSETTPIDWSR